MLPEFELLMPQTLEEALEILAERAPDVKPVAGGTNVIVDLREGRHRYNVLMDVNRLDELHGIRRQNGHVVVGGSTTIAELLGHGLIAELGGPLQEAAATLGSPLVRNRATVAGNLVDASPAADTAPPLLVLDAEVELACRDGTRYVSLEDFLVGPNETLLRPDELLVAVRWPVPTPGSVGAFHKVGLRVALACSVVTAAVMVERGASGHCQQARIALGSVAERPFRPHAAEDLLFGQQLSSGIVARVARRSAEVTRPIDDIRGSATYRQRMVEVVVRRLLLKVGDTTIE